MKKSDGFTYVAASEKITEGYSLGSVEKSVILTLAHTGPQTIHATKEKIEGHYKSVNNAFHSLKKKELIKPYDKIEYKNRKFDRFWLTQGGVMTATFQKANLNLLKENYEKIYGKSEGTDLMFDLVKANPEKLGEIYSMYRTTTQGKPKLKHIPISNDEMQKFMKIVFKYPSYRKKMKKVIGHVFRVMEKMVEENEQPLDSDEEQKKRRG